MYVIFPADEVILLSYGIAQNPRFKNSRPTLDHLREPIVPLSSGTRPSITNLSTTTNTNLDTFKNNNHKESNHLHVRLPPALSSSSTTIKRDTSPSVSFADDFMNKSRNSVVDENSYRTGDNIYNAKDSSGTIDGNGAKKKSKLKSKISRISLGKLGKASSSNEQLEAASSTRIKEDLNIRVANPTFTHDNLREKNFDAFFASGEPVYSLERKERLTVDNSLLTPLTPQSASSFDTPLTPITPPSYPTSPSITSATREGSIGFSSPKFFTSKQSSSTNSSSGNKRQKSVEPNRTSGDSFAEPRKGDRCPENDFSEKKNTFCVV